MRVLGIIPARAGSKRVPNKNFRPLIGRPLADYVMAASLHASGLTDIVVSSDSREVLAIAGQYPEIIPVERPAELASDVSPAIDYVHHALQEMKRRGAPDYDAVAIIQPSSPFTTSDDIDATISLLDDPAADSAVSIKEVPHDLNPLKIKLMKGGRLLPFFEEENGRMAAHDLPVTYVRNGSVYVSRIESIVSGKIIGDYCLGYLMPAERSVDINDEMDFLLAEIMAVRFPPN